MRELADIALNTAKMGGASYIVTFKADKTIHDGLATCGYDDDGVKTMEWHLVKDGIFVDYQIIRQQVYWPEYRNARKAAGLPEVNHSHGCCYADSWSSIPFQRMPNVHLEAGKQRLCCREHPPHERHTKL